VISIKEIIVANDKKNVLAKFNIVDETIEGTIKKITKGLVIPPVKKINKVN
tara:strand:- start:1379 stop:1531 length:153 start_codon:yes stop_codon:yes gene_type:complete